MFAALGCTDISILKSGFQFSDLQNDQDGNWYQKYQFGKKVFVKVSGVWL